MSRLVLVSLCLYLLGCAADGDPSSSPPAQAAAPAPSGLAQWALRLDLRDTSGPAFVALATGRVKRGSLSSDEEETFDFSVETDPWRIESTQKRMFNFLGVTGRRGFDTLREIPTDYFVPRMGSEELVVGALFGVRTNAERYAKVLIADKTETSLDLLVVYQPDGSRLFPDE